MNYVPESSLEQQCLDYFREQPIFKRLLTGFRKKYDSYGSFSGTVVLKSLTVEDRETLEGFLGKNYHGKNIASVSAGLFADALAASRFQLVTPVRLLELFFCQPMTGKREIQDQYRLQWESMLEKTAQTAGIDCNSAAVSLSAKWFHEKREELQNVRQLDEPRLRQTGEELNLSVRILQELPALKNRHEYLAVFASRLTGDPHAFDADRKEGRLLSQLVAWYADNCNGNNDLSNHPKQEEVFRSLKQQKQYLLAGILRDDISNYAILSGVLATCRNGLPHRGMDGFQKENQMVLVPLSVIAEWKEVHCPRHQIYIVENPSIFAILCSEHKNTAFMCMNGQPRLASLLVLDLLAQDDTCVYYSGDLDPEGLMIAQKLKNYYPGRFYYWKMSVTDYQVSRSSRAISAQRMKILEHIKDEELMPVASVMKQERLAGYQENLSWEDSLTIG